MTDDRLYFRQLLAGRDFALSNPVAGQMVNFVYLIGDKVSRQCMVVDPAWSIKDLLDLVAQDDMQITGALATHYHADHVGGNLMGACNVEGIAELLEHVQVPVHCQKDEAQWISRSTGVEADDLQTHDSGDEVFVGDLPIRLIHTPGHTPGSQCFLVGDRLVAGDTLFLEGCGPTDLPGDNSEELYRSLHQRLSKLTDDTILYPGHLYSSDSQATMGETRSNNHVFQVSSLEDWLRFMP